MDSSTSSVFQKCMNCITFNVFSKVFYKSDTVHADFGQKVYELYHF